MVRIRLASVFLMASAACAEVATTGMAVRSATADEGGGRVEVVVDTALPQGAVLTGTILRGDSPVAHARGEVDERGVAVLLFDVAGVRFYPGAYRVSVDCQPREQQGEAAEALERASLEPAVHEFRIGTPEEATRFQESVKSKLLRILREMGTLYGEMHQYGGFSIAAAEVAERKHGGSIPEVEARRIFRKLDEQGERDWEPRLATQRLDWNDFTAQAPGAAPTDAERCLAEMFPLFERWYGRYWRDVADRLGVDPPARVRLVDFPRLELETEIETCAARAYQALGAFDRFETDSWKVVTTAKPERGRVRGDTYESWSSKFRVTLPSDQWEFDFTLVSPAVRVRILPKDPALRKTAGIVVEIKDWPAAEGAKDLDRILEVFATERWPGHRRLRGESIRATDRTMPEGWRPGYDMTCVTADGDARFRVRDRELYCRWLKRTYGVLCMAEQSSFDRFAKDFEKVCSSLVVLDDPEFAEKARLEESEAERAALGKGGESSR